MYRPYDLILKKRHGEELSAEELQFLVEGFVDGSVADYQLAAWAMAVCFQGMTSRELSAFTDAMVRSGDVVDLSGLPGAPVDKHSTGGVGDTTSLVLIPLVAASGLCVAKMSGRGLGHTGGTLDKLESIPGLTTGLTPERLISQVKRIGLAIAAQTANLVPADKKLYALRDVTATVDSIPLIASSIMSKKLAGGARAVVLDIKVGRGSFMHTTARAKELARAMIGIGERAGIETRAVLTRMDHPLGSAIGNALEVREAIAVLHGRGPADLRELCIQLGGLMCLAGGAVRSSSEGNELCRRNLDSGAALSKFAELVHAQGGPSELCDNPDLLPRAPITLEVRSGETGWIQSIDALTCGRVAVGLGAGRMRKGAAIDPATGIVLRKKVGDLVEPGDPWAVIHARTHEDAKGAASLLSQALTVSQAEAQAGPLIIDILGSDDHG